MARAQSALHSGDSSAALKILRACPPDHPDHAEVLGLLGELLLEAGQAAEAAAALDVALAAHPDRPDWLRSAARARLASGDAAEALRRCRILLSRRPDDTVAMRMAGLASAAQGDHVGALAMAREARFLDPDRLSSLAEVAEIHLAADDPLAAVEMLEPAVRRAHPADPARRTALLLIARGWLSLNEPVKAGAALDELDDPADPEGAALRSRIPAAAAELGAAFVRALFDRYADRFDADLVGKLGYRGPALIADALDRLEVPGGLRVLDAGCGTGLAGPVLRPRALRLEGFDLSPAMVEKARRRGCYDALHVAEMTAFLDAAAGCWDLVAAADVLVYVGDLAAVMTAAHRALAPGGRFVFTVERGEGTTVRLQVSRRYAHGEDHVRDRAAAAGLVVDLLEDCSSRRDRGVAVPGLLVALRRPAAS